MSTRVGPRIDQVDQHLLTPRGAMELPERFVSSTLGHLEPHYAALWGAEPETLVRCVEAPGVELARRFAAGTLLALRGDPRIVVDAPQMIDLPGGRVRLGLEPEHIDAVTARWARYGVKRDWIAKEAPAFEIDLLPYRIGRFPVTHLEYRVFVEDSGYPELPSSWFLGAFPVPVANHPVYGLSEAAADAYAAWLAARTGRRFRLPREVEWEHAAAGPDRLEFPWGAEFDPERANTIEGGLLTTTPVGMYPGGVSPFGVADMAGNVEEYVADDYWVYPGGERIRDDLTDLHGVYRVARGGSFTRFADLARCRRRHGRYPSPHYVMGFRLAEDVAGPPSALSPGVGGTG